MKITAVRVNHVCSGVRNYVIVRIETDAGIYGIGETDMLRKERTLASAVHELERFLIGKDPTCIEDHCEKMYRDAFWVGGPMLCAAISAVEAAMWDILGKSVGLPIYKLLGGPCRDRIRVYAHFVQSPQTPEEAARGALGLVAQGYDAIKMDLFAGTGYGPHHKETEGLPTRVVRMAREKVAAVREAVGPDVDLAVDLHGRLCPADAIRMGLALAPYDLMFLEEPVPPENIDALEMVARALPMPIASGERLNTKYGFRELLNRRAVAIAQPDVVVAGGILETKKIAAMAEANYISVAPHNPNGPIATAMSVQVAACIPNLLILEFLGFPNEERMSRALLQNPLWPENGYIRVPTGPGLGIALKEEALDQFPYQVCDATR